MQSQSRFARAVRADYRNVFPLLDLQVDSAERLARRFSGAFVCVSQILNAIAMVEAFVILLLMV